MHVGRSHPFTLAPPPPESPFAVPMLLSPFPTLCIFLQPDYVRSRAFEHSHVLYPEESFLIRFPRSLFFLTRLFQGLPASWIRLHSPNQPVSALIALPRIGSRRILRSLAGEIFRVDFSLSDEGRSMLHLRSVGRIRTKWWGGARSRRP